MVMTLKTQQKLRNFAKASGVTVLALLILFLFLLPFGYGILSSLKTLTQIANVDAPLLPSSEKMYVLEQDYTYKVGNNDRAVKQGAECIVLNVPTADGMKPLAIIQKGRENSWFVDPANPASAPVLWEGKWMTLKPTWESDVQWQNYPKAANSIKFVMLLKNTVVYAVLSTIGAVISASIVSYGFARFEFPKKNVLFMIAVATIILPPAVTLIPKYTFFFKIGWVGTWLPIIVPQYFSNGWNIFLMRQFFMGIPREMEEAAKIDGAGPIKTFLLVMLPQAVPAIVAVTLFHFFFCWNDFFEPLLYLAGNPTKYPISIGLQQFFRQFTRQAELLQAASIMSLAVPVIIFFFAQRFFMQGVVITGVEK
jgi:multiple sugar transport system permease protein